MRTRLAKIGVGIAAIAALALGGSALASAAQKHQTKPAAHQSKNVEQSNAAQDGDNVQQGDQTSPDTADATDQGSEQADGSTSESGQSDGPGGYTDTTPNADTQQQGEN